MTSLPHCTVLGIESSCDETAVAIVRDGREVLSSVVVTQVEEHAAWGGVVPEIAGRSHLRAMAPSIQQAMEMANITPADLTAIAATVRPGLLGSLLVGVTAAKSLSWAWQKPLVGVHHIEAHVYAALMSLPDWVFPYITLVVSGGHTSLYRADSPLDLTLLGCTRDDAAGEALDKASAMLGLSYPGGPAIQKAALDGNPRAYTFKRPMLGADSLEFSFSGMKTALLYKLKGPGGSRKDPTLPESNNLPDMAASFEEAVVDTLVKKCLRACEQTGISRLLLGGGVACNARLRARMEAQALKNKIDATFAAPEYCTDNAVMVAGLGHARWQAGFRDDLLIDVAAC